MNKIVLSLSTLWDLLGYYHSGGHTPSPAIRNPQATSGPALAGSIAYVPESDEDADDPEQPEDTASQDPDRRTLQDALDASNQVSGLGHSAQVHLNECSYAAACLSFADQEKM